MGNMHVPHLCDMLYSRHVSCACMLHACHMYVAYMFNMLHVCCMHIQHVCYMHVFLHATFIPLHNSQNNHTNIVQDSLWTSASIPKVGPVQRGMCRNWWARTKPSRSSKCRVRRCSSWLQGKCRKLIKFMKFQGKHIFSYLSKGTQPPLGTWERSLCRAPPLCRTLCWRRWDPDKFCPYPGLG